jgi:alanyl-tRNA synthetase
MNIRIMDLDEMGPDGACDMIFEMMKESSLN